MKDLKGMVKEFLLREEFDAYGAFDFIKSKTGKARPREYIMKLLKSGKVDQVDIDSELYDDELKLVYKILYTPEVFGDPFIYKGSIDLPDIELPKLQIRSMEVGGNLNLNGSKNLVELPDPLNVHGEIYLNYSGLKRLPNTLSASALRINHSAIEFLPAKLDVDLVVANYSSIKGIPDGFYTKFGLFLKGCEQLKRIGNDVDVNTLSASDSSLEEIGDNFKARVVELQRSSIAVIGKNFKVSTLSVVGCTQLTEIPIGFRANEVFINEYTGWMHMFPSSLELQQEIARRGGKVDKITSYDRDGEKMTY